MSTDRDGVPAPSPSRFRTVTYGDPGLRLIAFLIDALLLFGLFLLFAFTASLMMLLIHDRDNLPPELHESVGQVLQVFCVLIAWVYFAYLESSPLQATFGKRAMGLRVTDTQGNPIGFFRATLRFIAKSLLLAFCGLGLLIILMTRTRQGFHDAAAGTLVLSGRGGRSPVLPDTSTPRVPPADPNQGSEGILKDHDR